jgi:hypothetical protein
VQIQNYKPMRTAMSTRFVLDGSLVQLQHLDLLTDGSQSHVSGTVDFGNWPRQTYNVSSNVDFVKMKDIFFAKETWQLSGEGQFAGQFKLFKEGGRELAGHFQQPRASTTWSFRTFMGRWSGRRPIRRDACRIGPARRSHRFT